VAATGCDEQALSESCALLGGSRGDLKLDLSLIRFVSLIQFATQIDLSEPRSGLWT